MSAGTVLLAAMMVVSWYGPGFAGNPTANGEVFDPDAFTTAAPDLPFGTILLIRNGTRAVYSRINDRGPFCFNALAAGRLEPHPTRRLDLSRATFEAVSNLGEGVTEVEVEVFPPGRPVSPPPAFVPPPGIEAPLGTLWESWHEVTKGVER